MKASRPLGVRLTAVAGLRRGAIRVAYTALKATGVANDAAQIGGGSVHNLSKRTALHTKYTAVDNKSMCRLVPVPLGLVSPRFNCPL